LFPVSVRLTGSGFLGLFVSLPSRPVASVSRYLSSLNYSTTRLYEELPQNDRTRIDSLITEVHRHEATEFGAGAEGPPLSAFVAMVGTQVRF
jgi:hypothetical protein